MSSSSAPSPSSHAPGCFSLTPVSSSTTASSSWLYLFTSCYLFPHQSLVFSLLLSLVFTLVFSRTGGVLSHLNSSTHRFSRFPRRNLCFYVMLAFAAMDTVYCLAPISLELAETKILTAALANTCPRTSLISFYTVQLRTLCVARSWAIFFLSTTSGPGPGELPGF